MITLRLASRDDLREMQAMVIKKNGATNASSEWLFDFALV